MVLTDGTTKEFVQSYQPISYYPSISRKYAGVVIPGGFVQVAYDAKRFQKDVDQSVVGLTHNWHVGKAGVQLGMDQLRELNPDEVSYYQDNKFFLVVFSILYYQQCSCLNKLRI